MTTAIHLCTPDDEAALVALVARFHDEFARGVDPVKRAAAIAPLLEGSPYGAAYLLGPRNAPVGYILVTFGWSVELGGMKSWIDEIYVRPNVRGRGIATEVLSAIARMLKSAGVSVIDIEIDRAETDADRLFARAGFKRRDGSCLMGKTL